MMTSPISIYDELKGKPETEIRTAIKEFEDRITELKNRKKDPTFVETMCPSTDVQLKVTREYLKYAKMALKESKGSEPNGSN